MSLFDDDIEETNEEFADTYSAPAPASLRPPRESNISYGFEELESRFLTLISKQKMPHAVILNGVSGIGKSTFAFRLARTLLKYGQPAEEPGGLFGEEEAPALLPENMTFDEQDPVFRQVASGAHPDLMMIAPEEGKKGLDVEQIRKIAPFLRKTASYGGWRVVIVDGAESMNRNAQNAILKILEEPPANTLLVLVANGVGGFLPTIRSRCRTYDCAPLSAGIIRDLVKAHAPETPLYDLDALIVLSGGSVGKIISFLDHDAAEQIAQVHQLLSTYPAIDYIAIHMLCERFARGHKDAAWENMQDIILHSIRILVMSKARDQDLPPSVEQLSALYEACSLDALLIICDSLQSHFETIDRRYLDRRQGLLEAFMIIENKGPL